MNIRDGSILATLPFLFIAGSAPAQDLLIADLDVVHTAAGSPIERASILVRGGKIAAVGRGLAAPDSVTVLDGRGRQASPGIIDCHSHIAVEGSVNEGSHAVTPEVRVRDVLDPEDPAIRLALAGGTTCAHVMHGSANVIGGQCAVIKLKWERPLEEMLVADAPPTVKFALGENPKRSASASRRGPGAEERRFPQTRMGVESVLREAFDGALAWKRSWSEYEVAKAAGRNAVPPRKDLRQEALAGILDGRILVHCHCYRADEILMILDLAKSYGIRIAVLHHVLEGYKVAPEIAAHGAGASTFADWWGFKMEAFDAVPHNAAILARNGVLASVNSDSGDHIRRLNVEAAKSVKYGGLSEIEALRLVTLNPARQLRIDHRAGTLEEGKDADIVLWNGHPLSSLARVEASIIEGVTYFDRSRDLDARKGTRRELFPEGGR